MYVDGEAVIDVVGGYKDVARTQPFTRDTLVNVFSSSKVQKDDDNADDNA